MTVTEENVLQALERFNTRSLTDMEQAMFIVGSAHGALANGSDFGKGVLTGIGISTALYVILNWKSFILGGMFGYILSANKVL